MNSSHKIQSTLLLRRIQIWNIWNSLCNIYLLSILTGKPTVNICLFMQLFNKLISQQNNAKKKNNADTGQLFLTSYRKGKMRSLLLYPWQISLCEYWETAAFLGFSYTILSKVLRAMKLDSYILVNVHLSRFL